MKTSQYQKDLESLKSKACKPCGGLGEVDDAHCGDISYNSWECGDCGGSGYGKEERDETPAADR